MIVECKNCHARYKLDEAKYGERGVKFKCSKCSAEVVVPPVKPPEPKEVTPAFMRKAEEKPEESGVGRKKRVVVADDTAFFRIMLTDLMESNGYEVVTACDGEEALQTIKHELPNVDLVLLDMLMPKRDGFSVIREVKKGAMGENLPILAISGVFKSEEDREMMKELGVAGYIDKNTPPDQILQRVNMILNPETS